MTAATDPEARRAGQQPEQYELDGDGQHDVDDCRPAFRHRKSGPHADRRNPEQPVLPQRQVIDAESVPPHAVSV